MRRRRPIPPSFALAAALSVLAGAGCGPSKTEEAPPATGGPAAAATAKPLGKPGPDTLIIASQADLGTFISVVQQSATDNWLSSGNVFRGLLDSDFDCRITYSPDLAESYEVSPDGLAITYHLARDQKWSDGTPITAKDVAFTYGLVADPKVASPRISYTEHMKPDARPRVLDEHTVRFEFTHAYDRTTMLAHTGLEILPEHVLAKEDRASLRGCDFDKNPVVSGPWKLGKWEKNSTLELVPNPNYTGPHKPTLARVIFKVIPEYATRLIELESGSVDMIERYQAVDDISRIKNAHPEIRNYHRGYRSNDYVAWNTTNPLFKDRDVRNAMTLAIDRPKIIKDLLTTSDGEVLGKEAYSWITPELCDYRTDAIQPIPYDPEKAKAILAEKGWKDSDGDGILDKDGKPFRFTLLTNSGNARRAKGVVIVQANLKAIGIDVQLEQIESNAFFEKHRKRDFEASLGGWSAGLFVDPIELLHCDRPDHKYEFNFQAYCNPKADELMERGMKIADPAEAAKVWQELQAVVHADQPYTWLYYLDDVVPLHTRFQDASVNILSPWRDLAKWWVPEEQVKYKPRG